MRVLVIGATGGSGRAAVEQLLAQGHTVTALTRREPRVGERRAGVSYVQGDAMNEVDVERAVAGQEAVVVTLGISENPLRVRLSGPAHTPIDVRSAGTRNVIAAMEKQGVRRLVVQTSYGVGDTRTRLRWADALFFKLLLKPQIEDTEIQSRVVEESGLEWVMVQPVHLTDDPNAEMPFASTRGDTASMKVSRRSVGRFLAHAVADAGLVHKSVALSARA
jgi:putative NADH-flavin reductase